MNWLEVNFDWNQIRAFLATAEERSFSAAARALSTTQPTITRQVSALEKSLNLTLFERSPRGLTLTDAGRALLEHVQEMGSAASRISMVAQGFASAATGEVTVTAVDFVCMNFILDAVEELKKSAPGVSVRILASNQLEDIKHRDADIAVRHVRPTAPDLIAKLVGTWPARFYGASAYLDRVGRATSAKDLERFEIVGPTDPTRFVQLGKTLGLELREEQITTPCDSALISTELVRRGLGLGLLSETIAQRDPGLECVSPGIPPYEFPVWLVTHRELQTSKKIRVVFDALEQALRRA